MRFLCHSSKPRDVNQKPALAPLNSGDFLLMRAVENGEVETVVVFAFYAEGPRGNEGPRDLIAERVRNGLAAAKARGAKIGRVRTRNSALIESLLDAGLSFREVAKIAKCSHGSVSAQLEAAQVITSIAENGENIDDSAKPS